MNAPCHYCSTKDASFVCGGCLVTMYCSSACQIQSWISVHSIACSVANVEEELVLKFMSPNCPDKFIMTPEKLAALKAIAEKSTLFNAAFKKKVVNRIDNFFKHVSKPVYAGGINKELSPTSGETIVIPLESTDETTTTTRDVKIKVKGACQRLLGLKSTETCRNDADIRLRVIDLNNLQRYASTDKYLDTVRATCSYDNVKRPMELNESGSCKKDFVFDNRERYVVILHHHFFDKNGQDRFAKATDPTYFVPYGITPELSTTKGLTAKVQFYSKKDKGKDGMYQLSLYYQNESGNLTRQIFGPEDVPFEYDLTRSKTITMGRK